MGELLGLRFSENLPQDIESARRPVTIAKHHAQTIAPRPSLTKSTESLKLDFTLPVPRYFLCT